MENNNNSFWKLLEKEYEMIKAYCYKLANNIENGDDLNTMVEGVAWQLHKLAADSAGAPADKEYIYPHDYEGHFVVQEYVPTSDRFYEPSREGYEDIIAKRLERWDAERRDSTGHEGDAAQG